MIMRENINGLTVYFLSISNFNFWYIPYNVHCISVE